MYLQGIVVGIMLATGQALWRNAAVSKQFRLSPDALFSAKTLDFFLSPLVILGVVIYIVATLVYMGMLARFAYSNVQGLIVTVSLIAAFLIARLLFRENYSVTNLAGIGLMLLGVWLLTRR